MRMLSPLVTTFVLLLLGGCHRPPEPPKTMAPKPPQAAAPQASQPAPEAPAAGTNILRDLSTGLATMAAQAKPAVVFVSVSKPETAVQDMAGGPRGTLQPPGDLREFMRRFFDRSPGGDRNEAVPGVPGQPAPHVQGVGSGFLVDLDKGYIVTNNHVVEGADDISIRLPTGATSPAKVVGRDPNTDLAVVQLTEPNLVKTGLGTLKFADSDKVRVGDLALALGAPFGLEASLSLGVISATGRGTLGITKMGDFMQTDAAINPGNSGGPLLDAAGQVLGVNTAIFAPAGAYAGIGFAIPSNMARLVTDRLIAKGKVERGYAGLSLQELTPDLRSVFNAPVNAEGAVVAQVEPGGPAAKAGVKPGDVITAIDGRPLHNETDLVNSIGLMDPENIVELKLLRAGQEQTARITLAPWPEARTLAAGGQPGEQEGPSSQGGRLGLALAPLTPDVRRQIGAQSEQGVVIAAVRPGSPAAKAGLSPGDVIVEAGGEPVKAPDDVIRLVENKTRVVFRIEHRGSFFFSVLDVPQSSQPGSAESH